MQNKGNQSISLQKINSQIKIGQQEKRIKELQNRNNTINKIAIKIITGNASNYLKIKWIKKSPPKRIAEWIKTIRNQDSTKNSLQYTLVHTGLKGYRWAHPHHPPILRQMKMKTQHNNLGMLQKEEESLQR